jgi:2-dehydropantoate 2-reductase
MSSDRHKCLRVLVFGAGAIGTYVGGSLLLSGHEVTFLERAEIAATLYQRELHLNLNGIEHHHPATEIVSNMAEAMALKPFDFAIFALKSFDTSSALESLRPFARDLPPILCLQNGVENETALASVLGTEKIIAGSVTTAVGRRDIGNITVERLRGIGIAANHPISEILVNAMNDAGLNA